MFWENNMDKITKMQDYDIHIMPAPSLAIVPLKVIDSSPAIPVVKLKQIVRKGERIAKASNENEVDVFSPIYGRVVGFDMYPLSNRENTYCVFIENLDNEKKETNDAILQAKIDAMKSSLKSNGGHRYDFDAKKFSESNTNANDGKLQDKHQNQQENSINTQESDEFLQNGSKVDKSTELNTMLNSTNSVIDFDYKDIEKEKDKYTNIEVENYDDREDIVSLEKEIKFKQFDKNDDILAYFDKCGIISQNGKKLSQELKDDKVIIVPCFDTVDYAYENSVLLNKHFEQILTAVKIISEQLNRQVIFLHNKGEEIPEIDNLWQGIKQSEVSKLQIKSIEPQSILKKHFKIVDITKPNLDFGALNNHFLVLAPTTLYTVYKALCEGTPQTTTYVTIGGMGLQKGGVYEIASGCTLEHIQNVLGGTHSEQDIEDEKTDALDAVSEFFEAKDAYKAEKDENKKKELKIVMKQKKKIADKMVINYVKTVKKKINSCLGQIVFDDIDYGETHGNFQAVLELKNRRVYYLSVKQC